MKIAQTFAVVASFVILLWSSLVAQPSWMKDVKGSEKNFYSIQSAFHRSEIVEKISGLEKNDDDEEVGEKEEEEQEGEMLFKRWEWFTESRVYPTGILPPASILQSRMKEYRSNKRVQSASAAQWSPLGPSVVPSGGGAGRVNCIAIDPINTKTMYIGAAAGGLWKSTDGGSSWFTTTDDLGTLGVSAIVIDPVNSNILYIATGDADGLDTYSMGVLKSTDAGGTWQPTGLSWATSQAMNISSIVVHPTNSNILLAAGRQGLYRTTDAGESWMNIATGNYRDLEVDAANPIVWYATRTSGGIFKSTDGGSSFTKLSNGLPASGFGRIAIAVAPSMTSTVYALFVNGSDGYYGLYKSTNSGDDWMLQSTTPNILSWDGTEAGGQGWYDLVLSVSPDDPNTIYAGGITLYKSTAGGTSWTHLTNWYTGTSLPLVHADQHGFTFLPGNSSVLFSCNDGGITKSTNDGASWIDISNGLSITEVYRLGCSAMNPNLVTAGAQDNGTIQHNGNGWKRILDGDGMETLIDYTDENISYSELCYGNLYRTLDGGTTMTPITDGIVEQGVWVTPYIINPVNPQSLYLVKRGFYKTTDRGNSWQTVSTNLNATPMIALAIAPSDTNVLYTTSGYRMLRSSDEGATWVDITAGLPTSSAAITAVAVHPNNPNIAYATFSGYGSQKIYQTRDGGASWMNISPGIPSIPVNCITINPQSPNDLYVGTDAGVYFSQDGGAWWAQFSNGLPNVIVTELEIHVNSKMLRASTYGRGLWETPLPASVLSAGDVNIVLPTAFDLGQNYPNPFNPTTRILYALPAKATVNIIVLNILGQNVATLVDAEQKEAGEYSISFDAAGLPSGMYFYRMRAGSFVTMKKMLVVK